MIPVEYSARIVLEMVYATLVPLLALWLDGARAVGKAMQRLVFSRAAWAVWSRRRGLTVLLSAMSIGAYTALAVGPWVNFAVLGLALLGYGGRWLWINTVLAARRAHRRVLYYQRRAMRTRVAGAQAHLAEVRKLDRIVARAAVRPEYADRVLSNVDVAMRLREARRLAGVAS
jgi:hypothetical protein